jgi:hypothetical protein
MDITSRHIKKAMLKGFWIASGEEGNFGQKSIKHF